MSRTKDLKRERRQERYARLWRMRTGLDYASLRGGRVRRRRRVYRKGGKH